VRNWESANGQSQVDQIVFPRSRTKDVLAELHGGPSGGHLGINRTLNKVRQRYYWLQAKDDVERWCQQCDIYAASRGPWTRNRGHKHQYNIGAQFERIAIDVVGPFPRSDQGNCYLLIAMDYFTKWTDAYAVPDQEASTVADVLVTNFFDRFGIPLGIHRGDRVWLYRPTSTKGRSPKLQSSWEGSYKIIKRINDVVYRIQRSPRSRMMVVHLDRLAPYRGAARDERP
jgi:hypothetical protein